MKPLSELDHYEILEARREASEEEIERSYQLARATYADESLAGYSVLEPGDAEALRERIEVAYRVLSDRELRRAYDASLAGPAVPEAEDPRPPHPLPAAPVLPEAAPEVETIPPELEAPELELGHAGNDYDGARLRSARVRSGLELEDIAGVTKINPTYLRWLEEEQFSDLPAPVYVRGFVTAYASCVGLDARRVASSYMKRFESNRGSRRRGRFF